MRLKKKILVFFTVAVLGLFYCVPALASPVDDLKASLKAIGVPESQIGNAIEYLQKVNIIDSQYQTILDKVDETAALLKGSTDITSLDATTETQIETNIANICTVLGLSATFSAGSNGNVILNVKDSAGSNILAMDSMGADSFLTHLDLDKVKNTVTLSQQVTKDTNFQPVSGDSMKQTSTSYGNSILIGSVLVLVSVIWLAAHRRMQNVS